MNPPRRPRKRALKLLLFLLAIGGGAILNVAVAWGFNSFTIIQDEHQVTTGAKRMPDGDWARYDIWHVGGIERIRWDDFFERTPTREYGQAPPRWSWVGSRTNFNEQSFLKTLLGTDRSAACRIETASGWPLLSMRYCSTTWRIMVKGNNLMTFEPKHGAVELRDHVMNPSWSQHKHRALPLMPIWTGFVSNTIFYAAIVWACFAFAGAMRRRLRIKRGQCASCGYSLRGNSGDACPECGAGVQCVAPHVNAVPKR